MRPASAAQSISGLPPSVVLHAGFDPLRDEALAYADRLRAAGVPVREIAYPGMIHGFLNMGRALPQAGAAVEELSEAIPAVLAKAVPARRRAG